MATIANLPDRTPGEINLDDVLTYLSVYENPRSVRYKRLVTLRDIVRLVADEIERRDAEKRSA